MDINIDPIVMFAVCVTAVVCRLITSRERRTR